MRRKDSAAPAPTRREQHATAVGPGPCGQADDADDEANRLVRRLAERYRGLPAEVITHQVGEVRAALRWLGDDPEMKDALIKAVEHNLSQVENALANGADLSLGHGRR